MKCKRLYNVCQFSTVQHGDPVKHCKPAIMEKKSLYIKKGLCNVINAEGSGQCSLKLSKKKKKKVVVEWDLEIKVTGKAIGIKGNTK